MAAIFVWPEWHGEGVAPETSEPMWFSVRCLLGFDGGFEERTTLWRARSHDQASAMAGEDSELYAGVLRARHVGVVGAFLLAEDSLGPGSELFSLRRDSDLSADDYLRRFLVTGAEHPAMVDILGDERFLD